MAMTSVNLRQRKGAKGMNHLFLDYYPPLFNPVSRRSTRRESLGMSIYAEPANGIQKNYNEEVLRLAEAIRCKRSLQVMNGDLGFIEESFKKCDFLEFFMMRAKKKNDAWILAHDMFKEFMNGKCLFEHITVQLSEDYKYWLLNNAMCRGKNSKKKLSQNTACKYFLIYRAVLKDAYRSRCIKENVNDFLDNIPTKKGRREYLTYEEVKRLYDAPCEYDVLRRASFFSILTGLRYSDIASLKWSEICVAPDGKPCIRKKIKKTDSEETIFVSQQAVDICGEHNGYELVFRDLSKSMLQKPLKEWIKKAKIHKHITFHCFRHTNATLMVSNGVDIYTVSKQLTHTNVKTTEIYLHLVDHKRRDAAESIVIK